MFPFPWGFVGRWLDSGGDGVGGVQEPLLAPDPLLSHLLCFALHLLLRFPLSFTYFHAL
jgi:hypothetical protein